MDTIIPLKRCNKCLKEFPATTEYFTAHKRGRYGLNEKCKGCRKASRRKTPLLEPAPYGHKRCSKCKEIKPATSEYFHRNPKGVYGLVSRCKQCVCPPKALIVPEGYKYCHDCQQALPATIDYFYKRTTTAIGLGPYCKPCSLVRGKRSLQRAKECPPTLPDTLTTLVCVACGEEKPIAKFPKRLTYRYGMDTRCRTCTNKAHKIIMDKPEQKAKLAILNHRNYEENKPARKERHQEWKHNNPEWVVADTHKRRALKRSVPGTYTPEQIREKLKLQKYRCYYCQHKLEKEDGKYIYHVDHTIPLTRLDAMPRNDISYVVLACPTCNMKKFTKLPHEWFEGGRLM